LKKHGFEELRTAKGSHRQFWNPATTRIVTIAVHAKNRCRARSAAPHSQGRRHRRQGARMTSHYPIVLEHEANGTVSAYVVGVPGVFAAADTERAAATAIRSALKLHLGALDRLPQAARPRRAALRVARVTYSRSDATLQVGIVGLGALLGRKRTPAKAAAARANGRKGGRPRKIPSASPRRQP
jgi:predicted RNase H-like HicB family nuclease